MSTTFTTTTSPISQGEINNTLWKACDTFRGTVNPSEYKNFISILLLYKERYWRLPDSFSLQNQTHYGGLFILCLSFTGLTKKEAQYG